MKIDLVQYIDEKFYKNYQNNWDDIIFREIILKTINKESVVLDFGCGRGNIKQMKFLDDVKFIAGVDIDNAVFDNPYLHEGKKLDLSDFRIPYENCTFDVVFSDNVIEHVENPEEVFSEISRVLKPNGYFLAKTPNKYHYLPLISTITPTWFHKYYNNLRGRDISDTFPTLYRCNSEKNVVKYARKFKFEVSKVALIEGRPEYLRISFLSYLVGLFYERLVNSTNYLKHFRILLIFKIQKKNSING